MRDGRRDRAAREAQPLHEAEADRPRAAVALDARRLGEVEARVGPTAPPVTRASTTRCSVASAPGTMPIARTRAVSPVASTRRSSAVSGRCRWTVRRKAAGGSSRGSSAPASIVRPSAMTRCGRSSSQVLDEEDVRAPAGRDRADVVAAADVLGGVDGRELDGEQRVQARGDRGADGMVEGPVASSVSGCMSSVTSSAWRLSTPSSVRTFTHSATSCHALPSRNWTHMPARSLASASSRWTVSWSESTPAHT